MSFHDASPPICNANAFYGQIAYESACLRRVKLSAVCDSMRHAFRNTMQNFVAHARQIWECHHQYSPVTFLPV